MIGGIDEGEDDGLQEDTFGELNATADTIVRLS